jgi:hypothetical protein
MTDRYEKIRKALEMGPTPGEWYWSDPDTIRALLAERDALAAKVERLAMALRRYGVHDQTCSAMDILICTCGLDAALEQEDRND